MNSITIKIVCKKQLDEFQRLQFSLLRIRRHIKDKTSNERFYSERLATSEMLVIQTENHQRFTKLLTRHVELRPLKPVEQCICRKVKTYAL